MKKGVILFTGLLIVLLFNVYAVSYGERIPRVQEFPAERMQRALEARGAQQQTLSSGNDLRDVQRNLNLLNDQFVALQSTVQDARGEQNAQVNIVLSELATLRGSVEELRRIKEDLPLLVAKEVPPPVFLTLLTLINFLFLCATLAMLWYITRASVEQTTPHHTHRDLYDYIKKSLRSGIHLRQIKHHLVDHGWNEDDVDKAIHEIREGEK